MADNHSFLPEDYLEKRAQKRTNFISLTLLVIVMAGVVAAWYVTVQQRSEVRHQQQLVNTQFEEAARRLDQYEKLQKQREQMIHKAYVTGTLVERVPRSVLLAELINSMPPNLSLLDMQLDTKVIAAAPPPTTAMERAGRNRAKKQKQQEAALPKPPETQVRIVLTGIAPTDVQVAQFMSTLGHNAMFTEQHLGFSEETILRSRSMRKFRVDIELTRGFDVQDHQPMMVKRQDVANPMDAALTQQQQQTGGAVDPSLRRSDVPIPQQ